MASELPTGEQALLAEAASKTGLVWLRPQGQARSWPAWHVWHEGAVHVVSGPGEQTLPELSGGVDVLVRSKESGARLITVPATAERLSPDDDRWLPAATALAASRLNSAVSPAELPAHWAGTATVTRIAAAGEALERPGAYDQASGAASPAPASGTTSTWRPWHLFGRGRRGRR
ncbi:MAG TPA: hypothetical protein VF661_08045 [Actinomycetales bacterium]|jgi:hypothetical protein